MHSIRTGERPGQSEQSERSAIRHKLRDRREIQEEKELAIAVSRGNLDARLMSEYHWRVWHPANPRLTWDFWPRTQKARPTFSSEAALDCTVTDLVRRLAPGVLP